MDKSDKGILIITSVWLTLNISTYFLFGKDATVFVNFSCMAIIWFGRKILCRFLGI